MGKHLKEWMITLIFFYPGGLDNTTLSIPIEKKLKSIKLKFYIDYKGNSKTAGVVNVSIYGDKKELFSQTIDYKEKPVEITLNLEDVKNLKFIVNKEKDLDNDWLMMDIVNLEEVDK